MFYSTFCFPMPFWSQRKVLTIPYKASTPFKSLGIMRKSVSDKKKLLQFLVGKRQLSVVIRWAPALVSPINNLLSLSRVSFCREGSLFGTDLEKLPINWLRPHTHWVGRPSTQEYPISSSQRNYLPGCRLPFLLVWTIPQAPVASISFQNWFAAPVGLLTCQSYWWCPFPTDLEA